MSRIPCLLALSLLGCATDPADLSELGSEVTSQNKIALNKIALNKIALNKIALNSLGAASLSAGDMVGTEDGRELMTYLVQCALTEGDSVTVTATDGTDYTFAGALGLAPGWKTSTPTAADKRWTSACLLARVNHYGVSVELSMRGNHPALTIDAAEAAAFTSTEGGFYGDIFGAELEMYACAGDNSPTAVQAKLDGMRACTTTTDGVTTACSFEYGGLCGAADDAGPAACTDATSPFGGCAPARDTSAPRYDEVITVHLAP